MYILTTLNTLFNIARTILGYFLIAENNSQQSKKKVEQKIHHPNN